MRIKIKSTPIITLKRKKWEKIIMNNELTILGIDTTLEKIIIFLAERTEKNKIKIIDKIEKDGKDKGEEMVLKIIAQILEKHKLKPKDLELFAVNPGPRGRGGEEARFTATRVGISIANTFAFSLAKKVVPFVWSKGRIISGGAREFVLPKYIRGANITKASTG